jgi:hypothetical protein
VKIHVRLIRALLRRAIGWSIRLICHLGDTTYKPPPPVDLRAIGNHPLTAAYAQHGAIGTIPTAETFSLVVYPLTGYNPFVAAASAYLRQARMADAVSVLAEHYASVQPSNLATWLDVDDQEISPNANLPAWAWNNPYEEALAPWSFHPLLRKEFRVESHPRLEQRSQRSLGAGAVGPSSREAIRMEAERLRSIIESVQETGYLRHDGVDGDIVVEALEWSGDWRFVVRNGHHRSAALVALGHTELTVRISSVVRRDDVDMWPKVIDGTYSRRAALTHFDHYFGNRWRNISERYIRK